MADQNKDLAHRFHMDIFQAGNLDVADEILSSDFVVHSPDAPPDLPPGPEGVKMWASQTRSAMPDLSFTHHEDIGEGNLVVIRWTVKGTHEGEFRGVPATGKQVTATGFDMFRVEDGKLKEMWQNVDTFGMLQQLGIVPAVA